MDEYLFFQQHKKQLKEKGSVLSPRIFNSPRAVAPGKGSNFEFGATATSECPGFNRSNSNLSNSRATFMQSPRSPRQLNSTLDVRQSFDQQIKSPRNMAPLIKFEEAPEETIDPRSINPLDFELTEDSMKENLEILSGQCVDQYISAGFPPKIVTLLLKEISDINKLKCQVLDVGCGKGFVGEYLKNDGYLHITGMDCSKSLLQSAKQTNSYEKLERVAIGQSIIDESHNDYYDFVVSASMINNDGWDEKVFLQLIKMVKMGGFIIFSTKLNLHQENQYEKVIQDIQDTHFWKFITEHTFYRYDKLCGGKGKFSNKMVKVIAMQRTNNSEWEAEQIVIKEKEMLEAIERAKVAEKKKQDNKKKLNAAANAKKERAMLNEKKNSDTALDEEQQILDAEAEERKATEKAAQKKIQQKRMMENLKKKIKELMWIKLKENQAKAMEELEVKKRIAHEKRELAKKEKKDNVIPAG